MNLTLLGEIVVDEWLKTPVIRSEMNLIMDVFVVMPNHFHGIIIIGKNGYNRIMNNGNNDGGGNDDMRDGCNDVIHGGCNDVIHGGCRDAMHGVST